MHQGHGRITYTKISEDVGGRLTGAVPGHADPRAHARLRRFGRGLHARGIERRRGHRGRRRGLHERPDLPAFFRCYCRGRGHWLRCRCLRQDFELLGRGPSHVVRALRERAARHGVGRAHARDPGWSVHEFALPVAAARARRPVRLRQGRVRRRQSLIRRHSESDALLEGGGRPGAVHGREQAQGGRGGHGGLGGQVAR